mgnify:CR=1 FL=1
MSQLAIKLAAMTDIRLVLLSVAISIVGSYTVLDIAAQIMLSEGQTRRWWLLGSGLALGISTWAMHFTAILSHRMTTPVSYDFRVVLLSMGVATIGAIFGLWAVTRQMTVRGGLYGQEVCWLAAALWQCTMLRCHRCIWQPFSDMNCCQ